ncbi:MAG: hypothetical protein F4X36_22720 [Gammaproteobacteria bacterium]|nr:hypothetical protein [Gammaproteobacteria bacterium]
MKTYVAVAREAEGRAFRLVGFGTRDLAAVGQAPQAGLFNVVSGGTDHDDVPEALRIRFGDDAIVGGRGFGVKLARREPPKVG